jgi:hypothetical protein
MSKRKKSEIGVLSEIVVGVSLTYMKVTGGGIAGVRDGLLIEIPAGFGYPRAMSFLRVGGSWRRRVGKYNRWVKTRRGPVGFGKPDVEVKLDKEIKRAAARSARSDKKTPPNVISMVDWKRPQRTGDAGEKE